MAYAAAVAAAAILLSGIVISAVNSTQSNTALAANISKHRRAGWPNVHSNVRTSFNDKAEYPSIDQTAFIHPFAIVIGDCHIGKMVMVAPTAVCRGDEGTPIRIGGYSNIQDGVVLHALETIEEGKSLDGRRFSASGDLLLGNDTRFDESYAI
jgi:hypothetical protein